MRLLLSLTLGAAGLAALPLHAQEPAPLCSGEPAEWLAEADLSAAEAPLQAEGRTDASTRPWFAFRTTDEMTSLRLEAEAVGSGDPSLVLATPDGEILAENDDAAGTLNSRIETSVGPGTYCLRLVPVGEPLMTARVQAGRANQPALLAEPVDMTIAACTAETEATALAEGPLDAALASGKVEHQAGAGVEYLRFALGAPTSVTLRAVSEGLDPHVKLYDAAGALVAENDDADGLNSRLDFLTPLAAGDYCLGVAALSPGEGTITVSAEALDREGFLRTAWRKGEMPPPEGAWPVQAVDLTKVRDTVVLHDGAAQWLGFSLEGPSVLVVDAYGQAVGVDSKLALFGAAGQLVAENDDANGGTDAQLLVRLEPGQYRLAVMDVNRLDQPGAPIRPIGLVFERYERVE